MVGLLERAGERRSVPAYGIPERLDGLRALEVAARDAFWSFELERRGAEVVALDFDLDSPPRRRPATEQFDLIVCDSVLSHLRDQLLALERLAGLTKPGGLLISAEEYDLFASLVPFPVSRYRTDRAPGVPGIKTWGRMLWTAGYDDVRRHRRFRVRSTEGRWVPHVVHHARKAA